MSIRCITGTLANFMLVTALLTGSAFAQQTTTFVFGQEAAPPTLDPQFTTSTATRNITMNIFELLVTRGSRNEVINQLAESVEASEDNKKFTFRIREGISFHNGKALTSEDVLASFQRFKRLGVNNTLASVANMTAPDASTFVIELLHSTPAFLEELSSFTVPVAILPAEQGDMPGGQVEIIGTGPFKLVEWRPDSHVLLQRYDDYMRDDRFEGNAGFGGHRIVNLDEVRIRFMPEAGARIAALETGEVHAVEDIPSQAANRLRANSDVSLVPLENHWMHSAYVNHSRAPTDRLEVRRAIQVALDMEEIMEIATDGSYSLNHALQYPGTPYFTTSGSEFYNINDKEKAKALLKEAQYNGEEIVILTNSSFQSMYQAAIVVQQRLRDIGLNVRMEVLDWATAVSRLRDESAWNLWFTGHGSGPAVGPTGAIRNFLSPNPYQFVPNDELDTLYAEFTRGSSVEERLEIFRRIQEIVYEDVLWIKFGDLHKVQGVRANVSGFEPFRIPRFWNVKLQ